MKRSFDYVLFLTTLLLVALGLVMIFSASGVLAKEKFGDTTYFLKKELFAAVIGIAGLLMARLLPVRFFPKLVFPLLLAALLLLLLVFAPAIGVKVGGASRWIRLGPFSLQPSEVAKVALVFFMAWVMARRQDKIGFLSHFVSPLVISGLLIGLVLLGKDLGGGAVMGATLFCLMYIGGVRPVYLASELLLALPALYFLIAQVPYRRRRILAFLNPWEHQQGAGFQIIQSYVAFHVGSFFGQGLGEGKQKLFYLPEAHTDFIFSVLGEELGLLGTLGVLVLFGIWLFRAFRISWKAPDLFSSYLAMGITLLIGFQVIFNVAVVMGLLPTKGLPLPFVSYGGSSLVLSLFCVGILLNISSRTEG